jgi:2,3-bisphosphoglycerate-dependent phosphoglycerate mutase
MLELILIRHGVTTWNLEKRFQGQMDTPLAPQGFEQAELTAEALAGEPVSSIYTSDLLRAQQTALPIAESMGLPLLAEISLRERHFGQFEGKTHAELEAFHAEDFAKWKSRDVSYAFGVKAALAAVVKRSVAQTSGDLKAIVVVTHGGVIDVAHHLATESPLDKPREYKIENASINRIGWDGRRYHLISWGNVDHLQ